MNRRKFLGFLAAGVVAVSAATRLGETALRLKPAAQESILAGLSYADAEYQFYTGYDVLNVSPHEVLSASEYTWHQDSTKVLTHRPRRSLFQWLTQTFKPYSTPGLPAAGFKWSDG